jgi:hypothetical protein
MRPLPSKADANITLLLLLLTASSMSMMIGVHLFRVHPGPFRGISLIHPASLLPQLRKT